jgi:small conductance mechanosensitive channel
MDQLQLLDAWQRFRLELAALVPRAGVAAFILAVSWATGSAVDTLLHRFGRARMLDPDLTGLLARAARVALISIGIVTAVGTLGIDVRALLTGLGLAGFALGFALRDIVSNTLAGMLILMYRPFHRGDHIAVAGFDGVVSEIDLRYTTLTIDDRTRVLVPNSTLFTNGIRVETRAPT